MTIRRTLIFVALSIIHFANGSNLKYDIKNEPEKNKGWLRVCNNNNVDKVTTNLLNHYEVEADTCPYGAWVSENLYGGCVCVNGLWAISQSWCDEDYYVAYGKSDCFKLEMPIRKLTFLGNPQNVFEPTNFITNENGRMFHSFSKEFTVPPESSRDVNRTILRLRPYKGTGVLLEVKQKTKWEEKYIRMKPFAHGIMFNGEPICLDTDLNNGWEEEALLIYKIKTKIRQIKVTEQCPITLTSYNELDGNYNRDSNADVTELKVLPGQAIHVKSGSIIQATQNCSSTCPSSGKSDKTLEFYKPTKQIRHKRQAPADMLELDKVVNPEDKDEVVRTANLRVAKQELNWLLDGIRAPTLKTDNWKVAQKIKEVFVKVCPDKGTPKFLVNGMMRLFRLFYLNSRDFFPNGYQLEEKAQIERMSNTLDACLKDASELEFNYYVIASDCFQDEGSRNVTLCACDEQLDFVNITYSANLTGPAETLAVVTKNLELPENLIFRLPDGANSNFHDFPTETMWKVMMFTHFYCAKHFRSNPADLSAMMTKMENFFNEDMLYRWTRPGTTSFKIFQYLYSSFDLKTFAKSVDVCVAASKWVSAYPEWLNRPTLDTKRRKKRSMDNEKILKDFAYCLNDQTVYQMGGAVDNKCNDELNKR